MAEEKILVKKFDGSYFSFWNIHIKDYLYGKDLYLPLSEKLAEMKDAEWKLLDRKTMSAVRLSLSKNVPYHTTDATMHRLQMR